MELLLKIILIIHISAGSSTLITGPLAIFYNFKDAKKHRLIGKTFFYAMLVVAFSAIIGFLKRPEVIFYQFLLGIALLVLANIARGVRTIMLMKGDTIKRFDYVYSTGLALTGAWMLGMSIWHFQQGTMIAFPILFGVFAVGALVDVRRNGKFLRNYATMHRLDWMALHASSMISAFIASTTAFTVNAAHFLPWYLQWFGPTLLLVPVQIYFGRKLKAMRVKA